MHLMICIIPRHDLCSYGQNCWQDVLRKFKRQPLQWLGTHFTASLEIEFGKSLIGKVRYKMTAGLGPWFVAVLVLCNILSGSEAGLFRRRRRSFGGFGFIRNYQRLISWVYSHPVDLFFLMLIANSDKYWSKCRYDLKYLSLLIIADQCRIPIEKYMYCLNSPFLYKTICGVALDTIFAKIFLWIDQHWSTSLINNHFCSVLIGIDRH